MSNDTPTPDTLESLRARPKCDGLWPGDDNATCNAPIVLTCLCPRCEREDETERFHACADPVHQESAARRHRRVRDRTACWYTTGASPAQPVSDETASLRARYENLRRAVDRVDRWIQRDSDYMVIRMRHADWEALQAELAQPSEECRGCAELRAEVEKAKRIGGECAKAAAVAMQERETLRVENVRLRGVAGGRELAILMLTGERDSARAASERNAKERDDALASVRSWKRALEEPDLGTRKQRIAIIEWLEAHPDEVLRKLSDETGRLDGEVARLREEATNWAVDAGARKAERDEARERAAEQGRRIAAAIEHSRKTSLITDDHGPDCPCPHHTLERILSASGSPAGSPSVPKPATTYPPWRESDCGGNDRGSGNALWGCYCARQDLKHLPTWPAGGPGPGGGAEQETPLAQDSAGCSLLSAIREALTLAERHYPPAFDHMRAVREILTRALAGHVHGPAGLQKGEADK